MIVTRRGMAREDGSPKDYDRENGPMFTMRQGERVRWYVFTNSNEIGAWDLHTPYWHGQTVVASHMRTDMIMLTPMVTAMADMVPDNPGIWLFHCHMPGHSPRDVRAVQRAAPR